MPESSRPEVIGLRPLGSPMPLGLASLAVASLLISGVDLGWIPPSQSTLVGAAVLCTGGALQAVSSVIAFAARDGATGSTMGLLSSAWCVIAVSYLIDPPGHGLEVLGTVLLGIGGLLLLFCVGMTTSKVLPAVVVALAAVRFLLAGIDQLAPADTWQTLAGIVGLVVCAVAAYAAWALDLEDAVGRPVLPFGRRASSTDVEGEPGVRPKL